MADHAALTLLIERKMADSPRFDRAVAEHLFGELEPLFRQQWEDELLSDEACSALAKKVWPASGIPKDVARRGARIALEAVLAATQKGGE